MRFVVPLLALVTLAACGGPRQPPLSTAQPGLDVADAALHGNAPATALAVAQGLLAKHPDDAAALVRQGEAQAALHELPEARGSFARALRLAPDNRGARFGLGRLELASDPAAAEQLFATLASQRGGDAKALDDLGIALDLQGRHDAAQVQYRRALALSPGLDSAEVNLGLSLALAGRASEAVALLQPLAADPAALPRTRQDLAVALTLAGDTQDARRVLAPAMPTAEALAAISGYQALGAGS